MSVTHPSPLKPENLYSQHTLLKSSSHISTKKIKIRNNSEQKGKSLNVSPRIEVKGKVAYSNFHQAKLDLSRHQDRVMQFFNYEKEK
jgi:hypothetical protein